MTPLEFSRLYSFNPRIVDGSYFDGGYLEVERGDRIGVVLLNLGGPTKSADVEPFLYNLFMDPAIIDIPLKGRLRDLLSRLISTLRAKKVAGDYLAIDPEGGSPINRLTSEQSRALELELNERFGTKGGVSFHTFVAMRYWHPFSEEAAEAMAAAEIDKVVLLPLYPHYSKTTTGASLVYWKELEKRNEIPHWPTTYVQEYATHPRYLASIDHRIEEGLQKFPENIRDTVHILFSAHGTPAKEMIERKDPYCCLVHSTVDQLTKGWSRPNAFDVSFQSKVGPATWLPPSTPEKLEEIAEEEITDVLIVPIAFVTDHVETAYELGIEIREEALDAGITGYEVTGGLNTHPEFIAALAESTAAQLTIDGAPLMEGSLPWRERPCYSVEDRSLRCELCRKVAEAHVWSEAEESVA